MISYCIAAYRPPYCRLLIDDLIAKTTAPFEILVWLNTGDPDFTAYLEDKQRRCAALRVIGASPENIGMAAYPALFAASQYPMVVQIDDDVVCVSPRIAESAQQVFDALPQVAMLTADVWQDEFTTGARPPLSHYRPFRLQSGLFDGPIDGWFAVYRRSALQTLRGLPSSRYLPLGAHIRSALRRRGMFGLLSTRMKVFHVIGPQYASYFGMLDSEIAKYRGLGRAEIVEWYERDKPDLPTHEELSRRVALIRQNLSAAPEA